METVSLRTLAKGVLLSTKAIEYRAEKLKIPNRQRQTKTIINKKSFFNFERYFYKDEVNRIANYNEPYFIPEIIYVHTTWEIRESKLNFNN